MSLRLPNPRRGLKGHNSWQPELHGGGKNQGGRRKMNKPSLKRRGKRGGQTSEGIFSTQKNEKRRRNKRPQRRGKPVQTFGPHSQVFLRCRARGGSFNKQVSRTEARAAAKRERVSVGLGNYRASIIKKIRGREEMRGTQKCY